MNIGCITLNAPTGIGFEMRWIMKEISESHNPFFISVRDPRFDANPDWNTANNYTIPGSFISSIQALLWVIRNNIKVVLCKQEQWNDNLLRILNFLGIKTIVSIDLEDFDWSNSKWKYCDLFVCPTKHCYAYLEKKGFMNKIFLPMGLDSNYFYFIQRESKPNLKFLHTAGHGGVGFRKSTPETVAAFDIASKINGEISLYLLSQIPIEKYPLKIRKIIEENPRIEFIETRASSNLDNYKENYSLYERGQVSLQCSKWEGMGASIYEALMMGMPVLTTNCAPMNEYVDNTRGFTINPYRLVNLSNHHRVKNRDYMMARIDIQSLSKKIIEISNKGSDLEGKSLEARKFMLKYDWTNITPLWNREIKKLVSSKSKSQSNILTIALVLVYESLVTIPFIVSKNIAQFFLSGIRRKNHGH